MDQLPLALTFENLLACFPYGQYPTIRPAQSQALELIAQNNGSVTIEAPTGTGKTGVGIAFLSALEPTSQEPLLYVVPNKAMADAVHRQFPLITSVVYGRNEYECLYYDDGERHLASDVPCASLRDCKHRVSMVTGEMFIAGSKAEPCPYLSAKYSTLRRGIVVCTMSFFLFNYMFKLGKEPLGGLVIDEAHRIASVFRAALSYEISDWHVRRGVELLRRIKADGAADTLEQFLEAMIRTIRTKPVHGQTLLRDDELTQLLDLLRDIDSDDLRQRIGAAVDGGLIDPVGEQHVLKQLETLTFGLQRYIISLEHALPGQNGRQPFNYVTYAYSNYRPTGAEKTQYRLIIKAYNVTGLIRRLMPPYTLAYSATIGSPEHFGYETGIKRPFFTLGSTFPASNTALYVPTDTADLSKKNRSKREPTPTLRQIARRCFGFKRFGIRCLVVVVSEDERQRFLRLAPEEGIEAISYSEKVTARAAVAAFRGGEGDVLVGTTAHYGEGIDLPGGLAPVTFFLRPGYAHPDDPGVQFEKRRYKKGQYWALQRWRVAIEALQVRGRNVRSPQDRGVTIFVSQQFRRFLPESLPDWLKPSFRGKLTLEGCCEDALKLLGATNDE